jgi:phosphoglycerate dehydrogenase-like enzyme
MKILLGPWPAEKPLAELRQSFPDIEIVEARDRESVARLIVDADGFFGAPTPDVFRAAKRLRWVQAASAGVEWLYNVPELVESDVVVTSTRGAHAGTIGEHVFATLLTFTRQMRFFEQSQARHTWARAEGEARVQGLADKTLGIIGLGNIGRAVGARAAAFEMRVIGLDAQPIEVPPFVDQLWRFEQLHDFLPRVDVLVVSVPLTNETRGMLGPRELALLRPSAYLLVVSRGGILDEDALLSALRNHQLAGAGLDVAMREPLPADSPLWDLDNLIITPHVSAHSQRTMDLMWGIVSDNIGRFARGEPLLNLVDKRLAY